MRDLPALIFEELRDEAYKPIVMTDTKAASDTLLVEIRDAGDIYIIAKWSGVLVSALAALDPEGVKDPEECLVDRELMHALAKQFINGTFALIRMNYPLGLMPRPSGFKYYYGRVWLVLNAVPAVVELVNAVVTESLPNNIFCRPDCIPGEDLSTLVTEFVTKNSHLGFASDEKSHLGFASDEKSDMVDIWRLHETLFRTFDVEIPAVWGGIQPNIRGGRYVNFNYTRMLEAGEYARNLKLSGKMPMRQISEVISGSAVEKPLPVCQSCSL